MTIPEPVRNAMLALPNLLKLAYRLVRDARIPIRRRMFAMVALAYVVSPVDLLPDAIPVVGQLDDVLVVVLALHHLLEGATGEIVAEHWDGSEDVLEIVDATLSWGAELVPKPLRRAVRGFLEDRATE